ncbi:DUF2391 family protein [Candidatus Woesearchaeota archaeon]|nr:DUF2391 family protein [Candidatus Woesearchaeota archaeon]MBW3006353.1 DUF2391 family protein [Candidatus Woesearchaeota archaeon]
MAKKKVTLESINKKLDLLAKKIGKLSEQETTELKEEEQELQKLEEIEKKIKEKSESHPLKKITYHDIAKGALGAFIGIVAHYTVIYGIHIAEELTVPRATLLFVLSYIIGGIFLYATGFRKVSPRMMWFLPVRLTTLYGISLIMSVAVLYLFFPEFLHHFFWEGYKQVAAVTLTALIGACTADLIGKE